MTHAKIDRSSFELEIGDYGEPERNELRVAQVDPVYSTAGEAILPVRADAQVKVERLMAKLDRRVARFLELRTAEELAASRCSSNGAALVSPEGDRLYVRVAHDSDRIYVSYEAIYRTIRTLAPYLDDCRFIIHEDYDTWVDEYQIVAGELRFERGFAEGMYFSHLRDYLEREAQARPDDRDWVRFCARVLGDAADYNLGRVENPNVEEPERRECRLSARNLLERAAALDEDEPVVLAQMGRLLSLEGRTSDANRWFERHAAVTVDPEILLVAALSSIDGTDRRATRRWLERLLDADPQHRAALQLLAVLAERDRDRMGAGQFARRAFALEWRLPGRRPSAHPELLHRAGVHRELLDVYLAHVSATTADEREALADELLVWAELLSIKMCDEIDTDVSREHAKQLFERAMKIDMLGGRVHTAYAFYLRKAGLDGEREALEAAIAINAKHVEALSTLGTRAFEEARYADAISLLERAIIERVANGRGGYQNDLLAGSLLQALVHEGNRLLEIREPESLRAADALFERAEGVNRKFSEDLESRWIGPLLRRSAAHTLLGEHERALAFAQQAQSLDENSVHAMSEIASCLNNLGHAGDALAACELAEELDDGYWHVPYVKACILTKAAGTVEPSDLIIALLERAIALNERCREQIARESDFTWIRDAPSFRALI